MDWWVLLLRPSTKAVERSLVSSPKPSRRLSVQVRRFSLCCPKTRHSSNLFVLTVPPSELRLRWWGGVLCHGYPSLRPWRVMIWPRTFYSPRFLPPLDTLELGGDVKNDEVFGEEIVVKDMHTRKALMNKLVRFKFGFLTPSRSHRRLEERRGKRGDCTAYHRRNCFCMAVYFLFARFGWLKNDTFLFEPCLVRWIHHNAWRLWNHGGAPRDHHLVSAEHPYQACHALQHEGLLWVPS